MAGHQNLNRAFWLLFFMWAVSLILPAYTYENGWETPPRRVVYGWGAVEQSFVLCLFNFSIVSVHDPGSFWQFMEGVLWFPNVLMLFVRWRFRAAERGRGVVFPLLLLFFSIVSILAPPHITSESLMKVLQIHFGYWVWAASLVGMSVLLAVTLQIGWRERRMSNDPEGKTAKVTVP